MAQAPWPDVHIAVASYLANRSIQCNDLPFKTHPCISAESVYSAFYFVPPTFLSASATTSGASIIDI